MGQVRSSALSVLFSTILIIKTDAIPTPIMIANGITINGTKICQCFARRKIAFMSEGVKVQIVKVNC
ncbi:hypothetical protein D3C86_1827650 [compost metagenome]